MVLIRPCLQLVFLLLLVRVCLEERMNPPSTLYYSRTITTTTSTTNTRTSILITLLLVLLVVSGEQVCLSAGVYVSLVST